MDASIDSFLVIEPEQCCAWCRRGPQDFREIRRSKNQTKVLFQALAASLLEHWIEQRRHGAGPGQAQAVPGAALLICGADPGHANQDPQEGRRGEGERGRKS